MLKAFYQDEQMRKAVQDFLLKCLEAKAIELTFSGEETKHLKLANEVINEAWNRLDKEFGKKPEKKLKNPAR